MIFKWFGQEKRGELLFHEFRKELNQLEILDEILEKLINEKEIDEEKERENINKIFRNMEQLLTSLKN